MSIILIRPVSFRLGAEEQDGQALERILSSATDSLHVFQISRNPGWLIHRSYSFGSIKTECELELKNKGSLSSFFARCIILDSAARSYLRLNVAETIGEYLSRLGLRADLIVSHTSALAGVAKVVDSRNRISRSVNFEPLHYLQENKFSWKSPFVFVGKIWLSFFERLFFDIWVISPNDLRSYSVFYTRKEIELFPLFQLFGIPESPSKVSSDILNVGYLGSTYNVSHNRASFDFITQELAPTLLKLGEKNVHFNIYGVKSPAVLFLPNLTIHGWKESTEEIFEENDVFIVPYFGGTGMQSKLFEPIVRGKPVIANPKAFAGYPFVRDSHYFSAVTLDDYVRTLVQLIRGDLVLGSNLAKSRLIVESIFSLKQLKLRVTQHLKKP
jgi:hypothetical protein